jgi:N-acetylglucosaminyldiphosphoundecaprenol N-acetyl-beta-D-mannosaminyltransferase
MWSPVFPASGTPGGFELRFRGTARDYAPQVVLPPPLFTCLSRGPPAVRKTKLFGIEIDALKMPQAVDQVLQWAREPASRCRYVVTPNVDHTVMFQENAALRAAYRDASLVLADGAPVIWASRLLGRPLPQRVTGSDLTPALFAAASPELPLTIYLLGAGPGIAQRAAQRIQLQWPSVKVVGTYCPPLGFENDEAENQAIVQRVNAARPDLLVLGLGAPKQELWINRFAPQLQARVALCVGATIDFLAGEKKRAPRVLQRVGLEWLHRVATEPRRLFKRYARDAWVFPQLMWREWRTGV